MMASNQAEVHITHCMLMQSVHQKLQVQQAHQTRGRRGERTPLQCVQ